MPEWFLGTYFTLSLEFKYEVLNFIIAAKTDWMCKDKGAAAFWAESDFAHCVCVVI